ncbi:MAG: prepilin-type N-terminal cleavage/methylation domain-containing protein [Phycisphaerae bacterium]|nr:prepilin-type N-terminal cleavage/methylation domain-containing protein [Phycisphaerae bacterium]
MQERRSRMKKKGFTLIELLVVIAIIAMLLAILMPALTKVKKIAQRVVCGTNLKGLGTAQTVYAHDYNGQYTVQGGRTNATLANSMGAGNWDAVTLPWSTVNGPGVVTVGSSLYLLVREADVSPKSFVCPSSNQTVFDGKNTNLLDLVQLWDFGLAPIETVSYAYHMPYKGSDQAVTGNSGKKARFAADGQRSSSFAVMADRNPWFDPRLTPGTPEQGNYMSLVSLLPALPAAADWGSIAREVLHAANSGPHDREGQNIVYADGSTRYETRPDSGSRNDNIYSHWAATPAVTEADRRRGDLASPLASYGRGSDDSVLVNDGKW